MTSSHPFNIEGNSSLSFEPSCTTRFLPGCLICGHRHPLAYNPPMLEVDTCPGCGAPVSQPGPAVSSDATLTASPPSILLGRFLLWIGRALTRLARKL